MMKPARLRLNTHCSLRLWVPELRLPHMDWAGLSKGQWIPQKAVSVLLLALRLPLTANIDTRRVDFINSPGTQTSIVVFKFNTLGLPIGGEWPCRARSHSLFLASQLYFASLPYFLRFGGLRLSKIH